MRRFSEWLAVKWQQPPAITATDYYDCFSTPPGQRVLQHLIDSIYSQCCPVPADAITLATHNGRRSVVHEILENFDMVQNPRKYEAPKPAPAGDVRMAS